MKRLGFILLIALCSCGGGGSGGSGGGSGKSAATGVRLLHGGIDTPALDVLSSARPGEVVQRAHFGGDTLYAALPTGVQDLNVSVAKREAQSRFRFPGVNVQKNERRSIAVYGDEELVGVQAALLVDGPPDLESAEQIGIRAFHGAVRAAEVQVRYGVTEIAAALPFGTASNYVAISAAPQTLTVTRVTDGAVLFSAPVALAAGKSHTLFIAGEVDYFVTVKVFTDA